MEMDLHERLKAAKIVNAGGGGEPPVFIEKEINQNGVYIALDDEADGYSKVNVDVPNSYVAGDEGKVVSNGELVAQSSSSTTTNGTVDTTLINSLDVNVANTYVASDEGKVVNDGALVTQTARPSEITENGTVDTTLYNSVTVNVPEGVTIHQLSTTSSTVNDSDIKYLYYNKVLYIFGTLTSQSSSAELFNFESPLSDIGITGSAMSYIYTVSRNNTSWSQRNLIKSSTSVGLQGTSGQNANVIGIFIFI